MRVQGARLKTNPEPGFRIEGFDPAATLQMLAHHSYAILTRCDACGRTTERLAQHFADSCGGGASVQDLAVRLRCSTCGAQSGLLENAGRLQPAWTEEPLRGGRNGG